MGSEQSHHRGFAGGHTEMEPVQYDKTLLDVKFLIFRNIAINSPLPPMLVSSPKGQGFSPKFRTPSISIEAEPVPFNFMLEISG